MAIAATPSNYSNLCTGRLANKISTTLATGIVVTADSFKTPAGTGSVTWPTGNQIWKLTRKTRTNTQVEFIGVESLSQSGSTLTTGTVTRYLSPTDGTDFTSQGDGISFPAGAIVELVWDVRHAEHTAFKDNANTFTTHQLISSTNELRFNDTATAIWDDGTTLRFKSSSQGSVTLDTLAATGGSDEKVGVSANDTTPAYLDTKITGGDGITVTETDDGGNETLDIDVDLAADGGLEISSGALRAKIGARGIVRDSNGLDLPTAGNSGDVLTSNGSAWAAAAIPVSCDVVQQSGVSSTTLTNPTSLTVFDTHTYTIPANDLVEGVCYEIEGAITIVYGTSGKFTIGIKIGAGASLSTTLDTDTTGTRTVHFRAKVIGTTAASSSSAIKTYLQATKSGSGSTPGDHAITFSTGTPATDGTLLLEVQGLFGTSNGSNTATLLWATFTRMAE